MDLERDQPNCMPLSLGLESEVTRLTLHAYGGVYAHDSANCGNLLETDTLYGVSVGKIHDQAWCTKLPYSNSSRSLPTAGGETNFGVRRNRQFAFGFHDRREPAARVPSTRQNRLVFEHVIKRIMSFRGAQRS